MGTAAKLILLCVLFCIARQFKGDFISPSDVARVKARLQSRLGSIPPTVGKVFAMFEKHMHLIRCLPTKRVGNCFESPDFCAHPSLKIGGKPLKVKFGICKRPWTLKIGFKMPRAPWYLKWGFGPIVIPIRTNSREGVTKIDSTAKGDVKALGFFRVLKGQLAIKAILRWDCTRPTYNQALRVRYNKQYHDGRPGVDYNKLYYKLHVRMEVKKKKFPCFCYKCYKDYCRDVVKKQGHFAEGPASCIKDAQDYESNMEKERERRMREMCRRRPFYRCPSIP